MGTAGIVRVGGGNDGLESRGGVGDEYLAVVGLEIQHPEPSAAGYTAIIKGMRKPSATGAIAKPPKGQPPSP